MERERDTCVYTYICYNIDVKGDPRRRDRGEGRGPRRRHGLHLAAALRRARDSQYYPYDYC